MGKELNLLDVLIVVSKHKVKLIIHFLVVSTVAVIISLMMTKYYKSHVVFMPQNPSSGTVSRLLGGAFSGDILGPTRLAKRQYVLLLKSRELREKIIQKFDLVKVYENEKMPNPIDKTLLDMKKKLKTEVEEEGGLGLTNVLSATITAIDKDSARAAAIANYAFELLEEKVKMLNRQEHNEQIAFLKKQQKICEEKLAQARERKKEFQLANHAYHVPQQVAMVLQAIGSQKAELLVLESQKEYLRKTHSADYDGLKVINQKIAAINEKINEMESGKDKGLFPGLTESIDLADEYIDNMKEVETYVQFMFLLRQQLEEAKVKRNKDYAGIYLIDKARPAEYKFKPKRAIVVIVIVFIYMFGLVSWLIAKERFAWLRENEPEKLQKFDELVANLKLRKK